MVILQPAEKYGTKEEMYKRFGSFICSPKHCVRIDQTNNEVCIDDSNKFETLIDYVQNFVFSIEDLFGSGVDYFTMSLDSIKKEMEREFCVPTEHQFKAVITTIKAELRKHFSLVESSNCLTFFRVV